MREPCKNTECERLVYRQKGLGLCHACWQVASVIRHLLDHNLLQKAPEGQTASGLHLPKGVHV